MKCLHVLTLAKCEGLGLVSRSARVTAREVVRPVALQKYKDLNLIYVPAAKAGDANSQARQQPMNVKLGALVMVIFVNFIYLYL